MRHFDRFCPEAYAADVTGRLLAMIDGDPQQLATWIDMNTAHGIEVTAFYKRNGRPGCFAADPHGDAHICYNTAYPRDVQVNVLVHESAHAVLAADGPPCSRAFVANYDDPLGDDRHHVCREVEAIIVCRFRAWDD